MEMFSFGKLCLTRNNLQKHRQLNKELKLMVLLLLAYFTLVILFQLLSC